MTDNFFKGCPAKMSDGRIFTDYRTPTRREEYVKYINNIVRDDDYRLFLEGNAESIMDNSWNYDKQNNSCWVNDCIHTYPTRVYPPWFVEERAKYDSLASSPVRPKYVCSKKNDFRATVTKGGKF